jgi:hypothetical protein
MKARDNLKIPLLRAPNLTDHAIAMGAVEGVLDETQLPETIQTVMGH